MNPDRKIRLSPLTRFSLEFERHLDFERQHAEDEAFGARLAERISQAEARYQKGFAGVAKLDALLLIFVATNLRDFEVLGIKVGQIGFATEALMLLGAIAFCYSMFPFISNQGYNALLRQWCQKRDSADADYLQYSHSYTELLIKIFRSKSTFGWQIRGDFYKPGWGFKAAVILAGGAVTILTLALPLLHLAIHFKAASTIIQSQSLGPTITWLTIGTTAFADFSGIALLVLLMWNFDFEIIPDPLLPAFKEHIESVSNAQRDTN